jgi:hypothetical protein
MEDLSLNGGRGEGGMTMRMRLAVLCVLLGVLAVGCCEFMKTGSRDNAATAQERLALAEDLRFNDIPVPRGFTYVPEESWTYETKGMRFAEMQYAGDASVQSVMEFFLNQMPLRDWEQAVSAGPEMHKRLRFKHKNKSENCQILIHRAWGKTTITIEVN